MSSFSVCRLLALVAIVAAMVEAMRAAAPTVKNVTTPRVVLAVLGLGVNATGFVMADNVASVSANRAVNSLAESQHAFCASVFVVVVVGAMSVAWQTTGNF